MHRRAFRTGIEVAASGVVVVNLLRTERLVWDDVEAFEIGRGGGLRASITVTRQDGRKIPADGLTLWGGDPDVLMADLDGLREDLAATGQAIVGRELAAPSSLTYRLSPPPPFCLGC